MTKIKYLFIFLFFVYNANSQTEQLISVDSIKKKFYQNYKIKKKISPNEFTVNSQIFLKLLNSQRLIYKSLTNKKLLRNNEYDIDTLNFFQAKTYIDLMVYGNIKNNIDSIQLYKKKVSNITSDSLLIGQSYGKSAYTYLKNKMYSKAIIDYQIASTYFKNSKKSGSQNSQITNFINLINTHIVIGTLEQASITLKQLEQVIINLPNHPRYKNLMELVKILKVYISLAKEDYDASLSILQTVKEKNLDKNQLKVMYYDAYHRVYNGLNNYTLGEFYLDKKYNPTYKQNPGLFKDLNYTIEKLRYAILKDNKTQADYYFNKLNNAQTFKLSSFSKFSKERIISNYYAFKNSYKKAYSYLKKSDSLQNAASIKMERIKFDVEQYYVQLNEELSKMKQLNLNKDKLIVLKRNQYLVIGFLIVFVFASFFLIINEKRKKKQFQLEVSLESQKTILESKEKFLENMSHEIRTPITSIIGYLNLLSEENLVNEKRTKYTKTAIKNSNNMISSVNNFLTLLRSDKLSLVQNERTSFNLNDFILERITYYIPDFEIKKIKLYYKANFNDKVAIIYDNESLKAIINNLISNAIKYSNSNTSIYFTFDITECNLIISVKDEGLGISDKDKDKIFERFYQTSNNKTIGGFGIGLSLISELVKRLEGTIELESELNKGSLFKVSLPYKLDEAFKSTKNYPKVLIVDDNTQMISYLKDIFSGFLDCRFAFNGKEAITKVKDTDFDLIISDVRMPEMDGFQFKKELNEISEYREIPFILISSVSDKTSRKLQTELGINEYLEKPFTKNEIISRVQLSLERTLNRKKIVGEKNTTVFDSSSNKLIEQIRECIISNITNPALNVNMLAETCGYNKKRLNEILKLKLGLSLVNVILEVKLLKAYELIVKNKFPTIKEVMFSVGINSRPYFYKKFNERFGIKIGELKNKYSQLS
jgi:signal transduction histidine kinase/DNA-binding NarL/FixJ family response regulator